MKAFQFMILCVCFILLSCKPNENQVRNEIILDSTSTVNAVRKQIKEPIEFNGISSNRWIKAYEKIYFGKPDSLNSIQQEYLDFLWNFRTTIANVKFHHYPAYDRYDFYYFGLMAFALISDDEYDLSDTKEILKDIKIRIDGKYPSCQFIHKSKETKEIKKMHEIFNKNLAKGMKDKSLINYNDSDFPKLKDGDNFCEYRWEKNGIRIDLCYLIFYKWVDNDGYVIDQNDKDVIIKCGQKQKQFYQPYLLFVNDKAIDFINSKDDYNDMKSKKNNLKNDINRF